MCFKPKGLKIHVPNFTLNGKQVDIVSSHKYLGVILDDAYNENMDLVRQTKAIYACDNILIKRFSVRDKEVKILLFKSYCSSFYCSQLWSSYSTVSYKKLKCLYNRIMRILFNLNSDCSISAKCLEFNIDCFDVLLRKSVFSFRNRLLSSDNLIIESICRSDYFYNCSLTRRWNSTLFNLH